MRWLYRKSWFSLATQAWAQAQAQMQRQQLFFHRENGLDGSKRIRTFLLSCACVGAVFLSLRLCLLRLQKTGLILHHKDINTHLIDAFSSWICFLSRSASSCMVCLSRCSLVVYSTAETKTKTKWNQKQKQNKTDRQTNEKHKTTSIPQDNADHITTCLM